jgi:hypothetical protein
VYLLLLCSQCCCVPSAATVPFISDPAFVAVPAVAVPAVAVVAVLAFLMLLASLLIMPSLLFVGVLACYCWALLMLLCVPAVFSVRNSLRFSRP